MDRREVAACLLKASDSYDAGTPNRMDKVADEGSLRLGRLQLVVLDVVLDAKQRYAILFDPTNHRCHVMSIS